MLSKDQVAAAVRYNSDRILGGELVIRDLPWPWNQSESKAFAWQTAMFQVEKRLTVDGKLGPKTEEFIMRSQDDTVNTRAPKPNKEKAASDCSNAIVVNGAKVVLPEEFIAAGLTATNYLDDGEPHFKNRRRRGKLLHFVLHETCGNTAKGCMNTLLRKGYGVQLIMAPSGHISCHGDLVRDRMVHANQLNDTSFGIEIVNPYNPIYASDRWSETIVRKWWTWVPSDKDERVREILKRKGLKVVPKLYVLPTKYQLTAIRLLAPWLCDITGVPYVFPTEGLNVRKRKIDGLSRKPKSKPEPGVVAHRDFASHSDGRYVLEYLVTNKA